MNKEKITIIIEIIALIGIISLIIVFPNGFKGSNAEITNNEADAILRCGNTYENITITWEYKYLNESESLNAVKFAEDNNCTFTHKRYKLNVVEGQDGKIK